MFTSAPLFSLQFWTTLYRKCANVCKQNIVKSNINTLNIGINKLVTLSNESSLNSKAVILNVWFKVQLHITTGYVVRTHLYREILEILGKTDPCVGKLSFKRTLEGGTALIRST